MFFEQQTFSISTVFFLQPDQSPPAGHSIQYMVWARRDTWVYPLQSYDVMDGSLFCI